MLMKILFARRGAVEGSERTWEKQTAVLLICCFTINVQS